MKKVVKAEIRLFLFLVSVNFIALYAVILGPALLTQLTFDLETADGIYLQPHIPARLLPAEGLPQDTAHAATPSFSENTHANTLYIEKTGTVGRINSPEAEETDIYSALKSGVVLYPGSALPGENGNTILIGHSWSIPLANKYLHIFSRLHELNAGNDISLAYNGHAYDYTVRDRKILSVTEANALMSQQLFNTNTLFLSSCWPLGTSQKRIVVTAVLN